MEGFWTNLGAAGGGHTPQTPRESCVCCVYLIRRSLARLLACSLTHSLVRSFACSLVRLARSLVRLVCSLAGFCARSLAWSLGRLLICTLRLHEDRPRVERSIARTTPRWSHELPGPLHGWTHDLRDRIVWSIRYELGSKTELCKAFAMSWGRKPNCAKHSL